MCSGQVTPVQQRSLTFCLPDHKHLKNILDVIFCKNVGTVSCFFKNTACKRMASGVRRSVVQTFLSGLNKMALADSVLLDNIFSFKQLLEKKWSAGL